MRTCCLLLGLLIFLSGFSYAGGVITNETHNTASVLHIVFSEPVIITGFGGALTSIEPKTRATEFFITGGCVKPWESIWLNWEPVSAKIISYGWSMNASALKLPQNATTTTIQYTVSFNNEQLQFVVIRDIKLHVLPFTVKFHVEPVNLPNNYTYCWDFDKYVDTDRNGNPADDEDAKGNSIELFYTENYNPTVTLTILDGNGVKVGDWENMIRNDFMVNDDIQLDGTALLRHYHINLGNARVNWSQMHMKRMDFEYMSEYDARLVDANKLLTYFHSANVGRYVFKLCIDNGASSTASEELKVAAWVVEQPKNPKPLVLSMADVWNVDYDEVTDTMIKSNWDFTDQDAVDKLEFLASQGIDNILLCTGIAVKSTKPQPELTFEAPNLIGENDLRMLAAHIKHPYFEVQSFASLAGDSSAFDWMDIQNLSLPYYNAFFEQYHHMIASLAQLAESLNGQALFVNNPYINRLGNIKTISTATEHWILQEWRSIFEDIRHNFSGKIVTDMPWCDDAYRFQNVADYVEFALGDSGRYANALATAAKQSPAAYKTAFQRYLQEVVLPAGCNVGLPIVFTFMPQSYEGVISKFAGGNDLENYTYTTWKSEYSSGKFSEQILKGETMPNFKPSFKEQVYLLEMLIPVLVDTQQIAQIRLFGEYWKMLDFHHFAPTNILDYSEINTTTLQGKPGFQVVKLWTSILTPNSRNLYRRVVCYELPLDETKLNSQVETSAGETITLDNLSFDASIWADIPALLEYPAAPDIGFYCDGDHDLSHAQFWGRSGSKVASVKTALTNDALVVRVDLHGSDCVGNYRYIISYNFQSGGRMLIFLDPHNSMGNIALDANNSWTWIGKNLGKSFGFDDTSVYAVVPLATIADYVTHDMLCASRVDFHIDYIEGSRRELFFFPSPDVFLQCVDRDVLLGRPVETIGSRIEQAENGVIAPKQVGGIATFELGSAPHAVIPYRDSLLIIDYVGDIYNLDPASGSYTRYVGVGSPQFVDGAVNGNSLYVSQEDGLVLRLDDLGMPASVTRTIIADLTTGENEDLTLMGIEVLDGAIYGLLLDETNATYFLGTYDLESGMLRTKAQIASSPSLGELITLYLYEGILYTVDWVHALAYSIVPSEEDTYEFEQAFDLTDYVPHSLWTQDPRGFCWSQWGFVLATTGYSADTPGRILIARDATDDN